jgi:hypothetical protein
MVARYRNRSAQTGDALRTIELRETAVQLMSSPDRARNAGSDNHEKPYHQRFQNAAHAVGHVITGASTG